MDTSRIIRIVILLTGMIGLGVWFPWVCHRWIWKSRRLDQVARLLKHRFPRFGDSLLGVIELVNNANEQTGSEALCRAALAQVDRDTSEKDFTTAVPNPQHRRWAMVVAILAALVMALFVLIPAAGGNAMVRWLMPWKPIDRYTFAQLDQLPSELVVPVAEKTTLEASLSVSTKWSPNQGSAYINGNRRSADNQEQRFNFELPPIASNSKVHLRIGDAQKQVLLQPKTRPELIAFDATVQLPQYLQRPETVKRDVRSGTISIVRGSKFQVNGVATRTLGNASMNDVPIETSGSQFVSAPVSIEKNSPLEFSWKDNLGLTAKTPLRLNVNVVEDQSPTLDCRQLERSQVVLVSEVISFNVGSQDDYGVKQVGMEWRGLQSRENDEPAEGEKIVAAGGPRLEQISNVATFSAEREGIKPQTIELRLFVTDYLPGRGRVYSPSYKLYVLSEEEHAVWLSDELDEWFKGSLETYEKEAQLFRRNQEIRNMSPEQLDQLKTRQQIKSQAAAEKAQARRLTQLTKIGEKLTQQAIRNDQFNIQTLEKLAESIQSLKDISEKRMPSVADLLKKASEAQGSSKPSGTPGKQGSAKRNQSTENDVKNKKEGSPSGSKEGNPKEGSEKQMQSNSNTPKNTGKASGSKKSEEHAPTVSDDKSQGQQSGKKSESKEDGPKKKPKVPSTSLTESSMDKPKDESEKEPEPQGEKPPPKLTLPTVNLQDRSEPGEEDAQSCPAQKAMDDSVEDQEELLAEFSKVSEELKKTLADLEGSTFVKRLKGMARKQKKLSTDVNMTSVSSFGDDKENIGAATKARADLLVSRQQGYVPLVSNLQSDLAAYANRVNDDKYKTILADMMAEEVAGQLTNVADKIKNNEPGSAISHAELLADTFDRWAEQLVGPG